MELDWEFSILAASLSVGGAAVQRIEIGTEGKYYGAFPWTDSGIDIGIYYRWDLPIWLLLERLKESCRF